MPLPCREQAEGRESNGAAHRSGAKRYYLEGAAGGGGGAGSGGGENGRWAASSVEFEGLQAGQLTPELRAALGIGEWGWVLAQGWWG
jgi:hypothetical protein